MLFDITNWSPNYLSNIPYHLQLKDIILRAIADGRFADDPVLPQPREVGVNSWFQKAYAAKAYRLLMQEGKLKYIGGIGYCIVKNVTA